MSAQDIATGAVASLYRLTDELPAAQRLEAIEYVRRVESRLAHLEEGLRRIEKTCDGAVKRIQEVGQPPEHWSGTQVDPERMRDFARSLLADQGGAARTCVESEDCEHEWHYWRCPKHHDYQGGAA